MNPQQQARQAAALAARQQRQAAKAAVQQTRQQQRQQVQSAIAQRQQARVDLRVSRINSQTATIQGHISGSAPAVVTGGQNVTDPTAGVQAANASSIPDYSTALPSQAVDAGGTSSAAGTSTAALTATGTQSTNNKLLIVGALAGVGIIALMLHHRSK